MSDLLLAGLGGVGALAAEQEIVIAVNDNLGL